MLAIRTMQAADLASVVEIHLASFQGFFLSFLGRAFIRELYIGILADPSGMTFIAEIDEELHGFVIGTDKPKNLYSRLLRQRWHRFALTAAGSVVKNPKIMPRLLRAVSRGRQGDVRENCATLMSIAVSPQVQGANIGKHLMRAFLEEAARRGVQRVNLTTDKKNNEFANCFYQKIGFSLVNSFNTPEGRAMNEYIIDIPQH